MPTTLTFQNQPKISEHAADEKFNNRKIVLIPQIEELLTKHPFFEWAHIDLTFIHEGVASLVAILDVTKPLASAEAPKEKYVMKIPLSILSSGLEAVFLKTWESAGVRVPHVFDEGSIGERSYTIMEYIDAPKVSETYERNERTEKRIYVQIGELLRKMHEPKAKGYCNIVNSSIDPEYTDIAAWLAGDVRTQELLAFAKAHLFLDKEDAISIDEACKIIITKVGDSNETVYCHNDLHAANIFDTKPLMVFDPWPCFHHPYLDLSRAIELSIHHGNFENADQLMEGYFGNEKPDRQLLQAFIVLNTCVRFKYMFERNKTEQIHFLREFLNQTKHFLY
jgi:fructosamine-3-kinase